MQWLCIKRMNTADSRGARETERNRVREIEGDREETGWGGQGRQRHKETKGSSAALHLYAAEFHLQASVAEAKLLTSWAYSPGWSYPGRCGH